LPKLKTSFITQYMWNQKAKKWKWRVS